MSTTADATVSTTSAASSSTSTSGIGSGQGSQGISLVAFVTALATSLVIFGIQMLAFLLLRNKLARILYASISALTREVSWYMFANFLSASPRHILYLNENEQNHLPGVHGPGSSRYFDFGTEKLSTNAVLMPTSFCDTSKHYSLFLSLLEW
jgi:hypothetical protein